MSTSSRKVSTSSLVNSLAKRFDPNALQHQGPTTTTEEMILSPPVQKEDSALEGPNDMHRKFDFLSLKLDQLLTVQDNVIQKLESISQEVEGMGKDMVMGKMEKAGPEPTCKMKEDVLETKELCLEMNRALSQINNSAEQQARRLDGVEQIVLGIQQFISFLAEKLKTSKIGELLLKGRVAPSVQPGKDGRNLKNDKAKGFGRVRASSGKKDALLNKRKQKALRKLAPMYLTSQIIKRVPDR